LVKLSLAPHPIPDCHESRTVTTEEVTSGMNETTGIEEEGKTELIKRGETATRQTPSIPITKSNLVGRDFRFP
jgi:hypothetical protein